MKRAAKHFFSHFSMATIELSDDEKMYVLHGVQEDVRVDGRSRMSMRPLKFETELVTHANGSAHLRLANTDVLVGVKAELDLDGQVSDFSKNHKFTKSSFSQFLGW